MLADPNRLITPPGNGALYSFDHENPFAMRDEDGNDPNSWVGRTGAFVRQTIATTGNANVRQRWQMLQDARATWDRFNAENAIQASTQAVFIVFPAATEVMAPGLGGADDGAVLESTVIQEQAALDEAVALQTGALAAFQSQQWPLTAESARTRPPEMPGPVTSANNSRQCMTSSFQR